ncbi:hypothetical protein [Clostridium saccharoperbutylacetonicum]|nr:hypothetical protein [Clostridium saccharoperbutylacetonicum]
MRMKIYSYYKVIYSIKTFNYNTVQRALKILNIFLIILEKTPYLFFNNKNICDNYELLGDIISEYSNQFKCSPNIREKVWMIINGIISIVKYILKIRIIYILFCIYMVICFYKDLIINYIMLNLVNIKDVVYSMKDNFVAFMEFLQKYENLILIIIIITVLLYGINLNKRKKELTIEEVWENKEKENVNKVAEKLNDIQNIISEIAVIVYNNNEVLRRMVRGLEFDKKLYKHNDFKIRSDIYGYLDGLKSYKDKMELIKRKIEVIEDLGGRNAYIEYHKNIWRDFIELYIANSSMKFNSLQQIYCVDKTEVVESINREFESYKGSELIENVQNVIRVRWIEGLNYLNSIDRYLNYVHKRKIKFKKLERKINSVLTLNEIANELKKRLK